MKATAYPVTPLDPTRTTGLILCGMGGPDGPDAVAPFLRNLFADPAIFPVPRPFGPLLGRLIATVRAPKVRRRYLMISADGATPQLPATRAQAESVANALSAAGRATVPGVAMRYWRPYPAPAVSDLLTRGAEQFLIVPTYPQYSSATSGSTLDFVLAAVTDRAPTASVHVVGQWPTQPGFVAALATGAVDHLTTWAESETDPADCALVYVAHSLPQRLVDAGDVYPQHVAQTVAAIATVIDRNLRDRGLDAWADAVGGNQPPRLAFQSRVGPVRWLEPDVTDLVADLAAGGVKRLLVVPVSFTCEHIETLLELDVELREHAESRGVTDFARVSVPGTEGPWLASLAASLAEMAYSGEVSAHV